MGMCLFRHPLSHQTATANSSTLHTLWFNTREQWNSTKSFSQGFIKERHHLCMACLPFLLWLQDLPSNAEHFKMTKDWPRFSQKFVLIHFSCLTGQLTESNTGKLKLLHHKYYSVSLNITCKTEWSKIFYGFLLSVT